MYIPTIPISLVSTFVVEEKHGFNKSTIGLFFADLVKGLFVVAALGLPLLAGFLRIKVWAGESFVGWLMLFLYVPSLIWSIAVWPLADRPRLIRQPRVPTRGDGHLPDLHPAAVQQVHRPPRGSDPRQGLGAVEATELPAQAPVRDRWQQAKRTLERVSPTFNSPSLNA